MASRSTIFCSVELVTADGRVVRASKDEEPDLFWAVRGGGGNFGVVTSFEFQLHPVGPMITGGLVAHPFERARDVLRFYRDFTKSLPDELTVFGGPHPRARWLRCEAGRDGDRSLWPARHRRGGGAAAQAIRSAGDGCHRSDALLRSSTGCSMPPIQRGRSTTGSRASWPN